MNYAGLLKHNIIYNIFYFLSSFAFLRIDIRDSLKMNLVILKNIFDGHKEDLATNKLPSDFYSVQRLVAWGLISSEEEMVCSRCGKTRMRLRRATDSYGRLHNLCILIISLGLMASDGSVMEQYLNPKRHQLNAIFQCVFVKAPFSLALTWNYGMFVVL